MRKGKCPKCGSDYIRITLPKTAVIKAPPKSIVTHYYRDTKSSEVQCQTCKYAWRTSAKWVEEAINREAYEGDYT